MGRVRQSAEEVRELARAAGEIAAGLQGRVDVRDKGGGRGLVTDADLAVERFLLDGLQRAFPDDPVLSEETRPHVELPARRLWCVDPIDGTHEYAHALPEYAVQIGLLVDGHPALGAIALPGTGQLFWGWSGGGVWVEEGGEARAITLAAGTDLAHATLVHSRRHVGAELRLALERLAVARLVPAGGVGYKAAQVLLGAAHLYLHTGRGTTWWDSAAPAALVIAAGGDAADARGQPLDYTGNVRHRDGLLFAAPGLLGPALARLAG